jgi:hypothetical protein
MPQPWTAQELAIEWRYHYHERLAILSCYGKPDPEQDKLARADADVASARIRKEQEQS